MMKKDVNELPHPRRATFALQRRIVFAYDARRKTVQTVFAEAGLTASRLCAGNLNDMPRDDDRVQTMRCRADLLFGYVAQPLIEVGRE